MMNGQETILLSIAGALASYLGARLNARRQVRENNIYRWASSLITELSSVRLPAGL